ncbi:MAG TPA: hypothetical protein EYP35_07005 [Desulfobacterales bacterium]|nr:hypothetical protein [Desulfobacterales bacterium]HIP39544.1 hypothetical protein [Desulfocapsa sulfexigens]
MNPEKQQLHKTILLDASSAILLAKAGFHITVAQNYSVLMSDSVFDEITRNRLPGSGEYKKLLQEKLLKIMPLAKQLSLTTDDVPLQKLDRGERDTLLLFLAGHGDFVVTDDGAAARFYLNNRIPFVNSLLMLLILKHTGKIAESAYNTGFESLLDLGRYSEKVIKYARSCSDKELLFFSA